MHWQDICLLSLYPFILLNSQLWEDSWTHIYDRVPWGFLLEETCHLQLWENLISFFPHTVCLVWLLLLISEISRLICFVQLYMNLHFRIFLQLNFSLSDLLSLSSFTMLNNFESHYIFVCTNDLLLFIAAWNSLCHDLLIPSQCRNI